MFCNRIKECGHSFCKDCLTTWFDTSLQEFLDDDPRNAQLRNMAPHPKYDCPECRARVTTAPIQNYAMKNLIETLMPGRKHSVPPSLSMPTALWTRFFPLANI